MQNQRTTTHKNSAIEDIDFVEVRPTSPLVARADAILERAKPTKPIHPLAAKIRSIVPKIDRSELKQLTWAFVVALASFCFWGLVLCFWAIIKLLTVAFTFCKGLVMGGKGNMEVENEPQYNKVAATNISVNVSVNVETI